MLLHVARHGPDCLHGALARPLAAVSGVLKGYDQLLNLVLDEAVEYLRGRIAAAQVGHPAMAHRLRTMDAW